jgi:hypothetical protein
MRDDSQGARRGQAQTAGGEAVNDRLSQLGILRNVVCKVCSKPYFFLGSDVCGAPYCKALRQSLDDTLRETESEQHAT